LFMNAIFLRESGIGNEESPRIRSARMRHTASTCLSHTVASS
jgi:hypothetical protein